jgi:hypothetical protein
MKGFLIMDRLRNSPEQSSQRVDEGQSRRSSPRHFFHQSSETSLTTKEQMDDEHSDKRTEKFRLWCESKWTKTVEPLCRKTWTSFFKKQNKALWIKNAIRELKIKCHKEWKKSFAPYNKWHDDMIESLKKYKISYNDQILSSEWYNHGCEEVDYDKFLYFSQDKLKNVMEDEFVNIMHRMFMDTMMQKESINNNPGNITKDELNGLMRTSTENLIISIESGFNFDKLAEDCFNEFTGNKQEDYQEEDQQGIFGLELQNTHK